MNKKPKGNCYAINGRWMVGKQHHKLVHGVVKNQKDGKAMGHCWVEKDGVVYDYSNNTEIMLPKKIYYRIGQIPFEGHKIYKYTYTEMAKMLLKHEHWGPWESEPPR